MLTGLFITLGAVTAGFIAFWVISIVRGKKWRESGLGPIDIGIGFVTNFLDTLGIGSFATMSACFKLFGLVRDEQFRHVFVSHRRRFEAHQPRPSSCTTYPRCLVHYWS